MRGLLAAARWRIGTRLAFLLFGAAAVFLAGAMAAAAGLAALLSALREGAR